MLGRRYAAPIISTLYIHGENMRTLKISIFLLISGCQTVTDKTDVDINCKENMDVAQVAAFYRYRVSTDSFRGSVAYFHPEYTQKLRAKFEEQSLAISKNKEEEVKAKERLAKFSDEMVAEFMRVGSRTNLIPLKSVGCLAVVTDANIKYAVVKSYPIDSNKYVDFVTLVPLVKHNGEWLVYDNSSLNGAFSIMNVVPRTK